MATPNAWMLQQTVARFPGEALAYHVKQPPAFFLNGSHSLSPEPTVLVTLPKSCPDIKAFLADKLKFFADNDDVYHPKFSQDGAFIFQYIEVPDYGLDSAQDAVAEVLGVDKSKSIVHNPDDGHLAPEGPYFRVGSAVHQAWRIFADDYRAFVVGTIPASTAKDAYTYEPLMAASPNGNELAVAVPSRLYSPKSDSLPLNGLRVTIKDNIHLAGVKTSMGNRAYIDYYGPQTETAEFVRNLIDLGAVIVGKTKLLAFAGSEKPPNQAIDYFPSWNPRGDGYQRPAGSSTGAGVCVSGYPWCDMAIGTDTTGSGREPARATGVQGLRLSGRSISMKGVVPSSEEFDSLAFLTRSLEDLVQFTRLSTGNKLPETLPTKILYPTDWLPYKIDGQQQMNEDFLAAMEQVLGVQHTKVSLTQLWKEFPPVEAQGKSIAEYLENSGFWPMYYDNYHTFDDFRQGYEQKFGKPVYVSPSQGWKWNLGSKVTEEQRAQGIAECEVFRDWVAKHVLTRNDEGHGEAVILLPLGNAKLDYRDIESGPPSVVKSYEPKYFGSILGLPQIVTPIGQLAYESRISKRQEHVPVIATFAGAKGSDVMLVKLAQLVLEKLNKPTSVLTGRECFSPETNGSVNGSVPLPKLI